MVKDMKIEILRNNNGLYLLFTNDTPEERSKFLNKMLLDLENGEYSQYTGKEREQLLSDVKIDAVCMAKVIKNRRLMFK